LIIELTPVAKTTVLTVSRDKRDLKIDISVGLYKYFLVAVGV
jgi:hypothetical protein